MFLSKGFDLFFLLPDRHRRRLCGMYAVCGRGARRKIGYAMQTETDTQLPLFIRDPATGRYGFNSKAIEALGLSPAELARRGYWLDVQVTSPPIVPADGRANIPLTID